MGQACGGLRFPFHLQRVDTASTREAKVPTRLAGQTGQTAAFLLDLAPTGQTEQQVRYCIPQELWNEHRTKRVVERTEDEKKLSGEALTAEIERMRRAETALENLDNRCRTMLSQKVAAEQTGNKVVKVETSSSCPVLEAA